MNTPRPLLPWTLQVKNLQRATSERLKTTACSAFMGSGMCGCALGAVRVCVCVCVCVCLSVCVALFFFFFVFFLLCSLRPRVFPCGGLDACAVATLAPCCRRLSSSFFFFFLLLLLLLPFFLSLSFPPRTGFGGASCVLRS